MQGLSPSDVLPRERYHKAPPGTRLDAAWRRTTDTELPARELALKYKQLWLVEAILRTAKSQLDTRPISTSATTRCTAMWNNWHDGGISWNGPTSFTIWIAYRRSTLGWTAKLIRCAAKGSVGKVFQACDMALPPMLRQL
jgi:hypothetical protein